MQAISTHETSNLVAHTHTHPSAPTPLPSPSHTHFQLQQKRQDDCTPTAINQCMSAVRQVVSSRLLDKHGSSPRPRRRQNKPGTMPTSRAWRPGTTTARTSVRSSCGRWFARQRAARRLERGGARQGRRNQVDFQRAARRRPRRRHHGNGRRNQQGSPNMGRENVWSHRRPRAHRAAHEQNPPAASAARVGRAAPASHPPRPPPPEPPPPEPPPPEPPPEPPAQPTTSEHCRCGKYPTPPARRCGRCALEVPTRQLPGRGCKCEETGATLPDVAFDDPSLACTCTDTTHANYCREHLVPTRAHTHRGAALVRASPGCL